MNWSRARGAPSMINSEVASLENERTADVDAMAKQHTAKFWQVLVRPSVGRPSMIIHNQSTTMALSFSRSFTAVSRNLIPRVPVRGMAWTPVSQMLPRRTAQELYAEIRDLTKEGGDYTVHNYIAVIENMTPEAVSYQVHCCLILFYFICYNICI